MLLNNVAVSSHTAARSGAIGMRNRISLAEKMALVQGDLRQGERSLFERDWEVFVIRQDSVNGGFKGQTVCCEAALQSPAPGPGSTAGY